MTGVWNHNPSVQFSPDTNTTKLQLFQMFFFGKFVEGVLLNNINAKIKGEKV